MITKNLVAHKARKISLICYNRGRSTLLFIAIALSITAIVLTIRNNTKLNKEDGELNSIRKKTKTFGNNSCEKIQELARKIDKIDARFNDLIIQTKTTLETKIKSIEGNLTSRILSLQNFVSDLRSNVNRGQTQLGNFKVSTNTKIKSIEGNLTSRILSLQNFVSNLRSNVNRGQTQLGNFKVSTNTKIKSIEGNLTSRILSLQNFVFNLRSNVNRGQTQLGNFNVSTNTKIKSIEGNLTSRILSLQNFVSNLRSNVNKGQTQLRNFKVSTNRKFSKAWKKFTKVNKEIDNMSQKSGSLKNTKNEAAICTIIVIMYYVYNL
ncbi:uncharacterized protein LOC114523490 [Dendronephthya gigantea]|uniref:uncharacterized protein LOC114523490 n=1 Tax=Dendronephthya gigantea TaxID=151771 RepID=UPI00106A40E3|nr:uncharacterized protein LOC114523490 [Dendronephthya gigantea]